MEAEHKTVDIRKSVPHAPQGKERLKWYGPGLLWMLSSVGSGSVLFTPRIGARYGYELLWVALVVIFFQWTMIREVGRYTVATGKTLLEGFNELPGPKGWAVWLIFVPQLLEAAVTIAGIAALAGSAMMIALPGVQALYAPAIIIVSIALVLTGRYGGVEKIASALAILLCLSAIVSAIVVFPDIGKVGSGIAPSLPQDFDLYFILPWVGFILAGAAGIMWFSYWVSARGYGGQVTQGEVRSEAERATSDEERLYQLKQWNRVMTNTALLGVITGGAVILSFLILGAEVLQPEGIVPEGIQVAEDLTRLLSGIWGAAGKWIVLLGIMIALWGTVLADQDGWGRTFADATILLKPKKWSHKWLQNRERLKNIYALVVTAIIPLILFWIVRKPVDILSVAGIIAAAHTPVIVFLTLYLNRRQLPKELQPGWFSFSAAVLAGLFFLGFALLYFASLLGYKIA